MGREFTPEQERATMEILQRGFDARSKAYRAAFKSGEIWLMQIQRIALDVLKVIVFGYLCTAITILVANKLQLEIDRDMRPHLLISIVLILLPPYLVFFGRNCFRARADAAFDTAVNDSLGPK